MEDNKLQKMKIREILHWVFGVIAVISLAVTLILSPLGDFLRKYQDSDDKNNIIVVTEKDNNSSQNSTDKNDTLSDGNENPSQGKKKNYSLLIFKKKFISAEDSLGTIIYAKKDKNATMSITPIKGTSYKALCDKTVNEYKKISKFQKINSENLCSVYETKENGLVKRVYCIDDGKGSSIEIKYQYPSDNKEIKEDFDILLSMFKVF